VIENTVETIRLLVVSREPAVLRPLWSLGEANAWQVETAVSGWEAMERVQSEVAPQILLLDLPQGDSDSLHILRWIRRLRPDLPVIVFCYPDDAVRRKEATRLGAQDVVVRPFDEEQLEFLIRRRLGSPTLNGEAEIASENIEPLGEDEFFLSASAVMQKLRAQAELLAQADVPVLILGENGSGKHSLARLIHKYSVRSGFRLQRVNCAAMPGDLLELELFGADRPAEAGRVNPGKFEQGEKGTILLDEITEMPMALQFRLLQVLQDKRFSRPGGELPVEVDVRILASTSANLERALSEKRLREDLYYRLSAFTVHVPPLRQRKEEIKILLRYTMRRLARHYGLAVREFSTGVLEACQNYSWPGNLEELETFVKRYLVAGDKELTVGDGNLTPGRNGNGEHAARTLTMAMTAGADAQPGAAASSPKSLRSLIQSVKWEAEKSAIGAALQKTGWNRKAAARLLKVSYRTMLYKIEQYHMAPPGQAMASFYMQQSTKE
jgi:two-component system response regulator AtoC